MNQIIFLFLLISLSFIIIKKCLYKETFFVFTLIVVILLFIPGIFFVKYLNEFDNELIFYFINLVLISIIGLSSGFFFMKVRPLNFISYKVQRAHRYIFLALFLNILNLLVLSNFTSISKVVMGIYFILNDLIMVLFWGALGVLLKSRKRFKYLKIFIYMILFLIPTIYNSINGYEFSRFKIVTIIFFFFIIINEKIKNKFIFFLITIISIIFIVYYFNLFSVGDLLITKYALQIIQAVLSEESGHKWFLIPYGLGFNLLPDIFGIKPVLYTANAQYFIDIMGWSYEKVRSYPFGVGITGIADAYWNLGVFGVAFYYFLAGLYLGFLQKLSYTYQSGFAYGLYLHQIILIFLLYRLDFSFYFGHLLILLPMILFFVKGKKI